MANRAGQQVIAIEEHYMDAELARHFAGGDAHRPAQVATRIDDMTGIRIKEMDEAGIDMQVLSLGAPGTQRLDAQTAVKIAPGVNDRLAEAVNANPERLAGFACLPTAAPEAAADELERAVTGLGFKGAMIHGLTNGAFIDEKRFWPIFERAEALDVPLYLHPAFPHPDVTAAYYKDFVKDYPLILGPGWGFTVEMATAGLRMVLSGAFEKYPKLKIILGHLGEGLPFSLWRIDSALSRPGNKGGPFREIFRRNFWITTSGNFSDAALLCSVMEMGADRILFAVDWPFVLNPPGVEWMDRVPLCTEDRAKILSGNARALLRL